MSSYPHNKSTSNFSDHGSSCSTKSPPSRIWGYSESRGSTGTPATTASLPYQCSDAYDSMYKNTQPQVFVGHTNSNGTRSNSNISGLSGSSSYRTTGEWSSESELMSPMQPPMVVRSGLPFPPLSNDRRQLKASYAYPSTDPRRNVPSQLQRGFPVHSGDMDTLDHLHSSFEQLSVSNRPLSHSSPYLSAYHSPMPNVETATGTSGNRSSLSHPSSSFSSVSSTTTRSGPSTSSVSGTRAFKSSRTSGIRDQVPLDTFTLSPLLRACPNPPILFDVTRPPRNIRVTDTSRAVGTMSDPATSPSIPSGYLIIDFSFPGLSVEPEEENLLQTRVGVVSQPTESSSSTQTVVSVWDVYMAISVFLQGDIPKDVLMKVLRASNGKETRRADRRGRSGICWVDLVKDGFWGGEVSGYDYWTRGRWR
ncbi:hypothetical protein L218DRAFT_991277 [Marasmius fiardii PR-910]|nr:hypothetical protein L218DRAFT_991277 [Marasmius fiardii PR-910]